MVMSPSTQIVISASRRTDIPAFYMDWFMERIQEGMFEVANPYNRRIFRTPATPDTVHTLVFWSKDFGPFINGEFGQKLLNMGYHLFFNFTINSYSKILEPRVPSLNNRLNQLRDLCHKFGAEAVNWRFDPICFFKSPKNGIRNNLHDFYRIAEWASQCGIQRCITSFMNHYAKIKKRIVSIPGFSFVDPGLNDKIEILLKMEETLFKKNINLYACCEKEVLENIPLGSGIRKSSCIPNDLFVKIFGGDLNFKRDTGQRIKRGCGCMASVDIGSYITHPCYHNCLFCYANPSSESPRSFSWKGENI